MIAPSRLKPLVDRWRKLPLVARDGFLALTLLLVAFTPSSPGLGMDLAEFADPKPLDALGVALVVAQLAPLTIRRVSPILCAFLVFTAIAVHQSLAYPRTAASVSVIIALYGLGAYQLRHRRAVAIGFTAQYGAVAVALDRLGATQLPYEYVTFYVILVAFWVAGDWMRRQRETAEALRKASVEAALATERSVIARELHDVVTHHVTAMVVQADAAGFLIDAAPAKAKAGLETVSGTGRAALTELRHLLQVLDPTDDAERRPAVGKLEDLVERIRAMGQPVDWSEQGVPRPTGGGVDLAVYRVVQEALTNAVKYANGRPTAVRVDHGDDRIAVEVSTEGSMTMKGGAVRNGRGLTGLRERVNVFGGEFDAGPTRDGGFRVRASIPVGVRG
ncbi:sensor histidine kinase [Cryptosporangium sp. NPDC051539]|uniref:sensor histidine kinase n=1 Tax=Cryptosporangium sp. NPDC051539 TaxID=3363962 RepID=UPI0037A28263